MVSKAVRLTGDDAQKFSYRRRDFVAVLHDQQFGRLGRQPEYLVTVLT
jgi:hypothetical protein